ncbi:MAG: MarR family transcriptional regulator [Candidatus Altiarchaeota archaeon]
MYRKYRILMVLCLAYGGFLLMTYIFMVYSILTKNEVIGIYPFQSRRFGRVFGNESTRLERFLINESKQNIMIERREPIELLFSPLLLAFLIGGLLSITSGVALWQLTRVKELKEFKEKLTSTLLTEEEKKILNELEKNNGELTQKELTDRTGFSRVKVHRLIEKLKAKKLVKKYAYGQTNKIIIES